MNLGSDIRIKGSFFGHYKTLKLAKLAGWEAAIRLQQLWFFASDNRPDGNLENMDDDDIALASGWMHDTSLFVEALLSCGWLDGDVGARHLHDYVEHQPWVQKRVQKAIDGAKGGRATASRLTDEQKAQRARKAAAARWSDADSVLSGCLDDAYAGKHDLADSKHAMLSPNQTKPNHSLEHNAAGDAPAATTPDIEDEKTKVKTSQASHITLDRTTWKVEGIADDDRIRWHDAAPLIDMDTEIVKFQNWCMSNPDRAPRTRIMAAITRWMNKAQEFAARNPRATSNTYRTPTPTSEPPHKAEPPLTFAPSDAFDWGKVRALLHDRLDAGQYAKWIERIEYVGMSGDTVGLSVADVYTAKHIQANFTDGIKGAIWDVYHRTLPLHMMVRTDVALEIVNE